MPYPDLAALLLLAAGIAAFAIRRDRRGAALLLAGGLLAFALAAYGGWSLRWQASGLLLVGVLAIAAGAIAVRRGPWRPRLLSVGLAVFLLAAILPYHFFPIFDLPDPDGRYRVGVRSADLRDASRRGVLFTAADAPRHLPITVWYPAPASAGGPARPYFTRREAFDEGRSASALWGFPAHRFVAFHSVGTHGIESAPVAGDARFPVVIFSHGYWSYRAQNSALMERLASHGYIVVSVAHPRDSADVRLADGTLIPTAQHFGPDGVGVPALDKAFEEATRSFMGGDSHAKRIAALPAYGRAVDAHRLGQSLRAWRDDVLFAARVLREAPPPSLTDLFARADFSRIIYAGMSFGGSTAPSACDADPRCVAAVDLDGENFDASQFDRDVRAPLLLILTDQPFGEHQRAEPGFNPTDYAWERFECSGLGSDVLRLRARGMSHMGMTDLVLSARDPFKSEHFTRLDGPRALALTNDTVLAFLEHHVRGTAPASLSATLARYPELQRLDPVSLRFHAAMVQKRGPCRAR